MKIVVAGGTGFLGRHIGKALISEGHEVVVLGRNPQKVRTIPQLAGAGAVFGDVTDPYSLKGTLDGADGVVAVVQFPNYPMEVPRKGLTFDRYDRYGTANLVAEGERSGVRRFFYVSGAGADPNSDKTWYRAKGRAEEIVRESELDHAILRPSWAYGPEDKALNKFVRIARLSPVVPFPAPMSGSRLVDQRIQPVSVDDVATAVARVFGNDQTWNQTLEIGSLEVLTMRDVVTTALEVMGKRRVLVPIPAPLMKLATAPFTILPKPPLSPGAVEFAVQDGLVDVGPLREALGLTPVPLREGLARYLR